jgi:hypothetical protein
MTISIVAAPSGSVWMVGNAEVEFSLVVVPAS